MMDHFKDPSAMSHLDFLKDLGPGLSRWVSIKHSRLPAKRVACSTIMDRSCGIYGEQ